MSIGFEKINHFFENFFVIFIRKKFFCLNLCESIFYKSCKFQQTAHTAPFSLSCRTRHCTSRLTPIQNTCFTRMQESLRECFRHQTTKAVRIHFCTLFFYINPIMLTKFYIKSKNRSVIPHVRSCLPYLISSFGVFDNTAL